MTFLFSALWIEKAFILKQKNVNPINTNYLTGTNNPACWSEAEIPLSGPCQIPLYGQLKANLPEVNPVQLMNLEDLPKIVYPAPPVQ